MIKVGTLTYHRSQNYGSVLQAYALEKLLNSFPNVDCEIIDYYPPNYKLLYSVFVKNNSLRAIARNLYVLLNYKQRKDRYDNFISFQKNYKISKNSYNEKIELMDEIDNIYDVIVCGSDQIWCTDAPDFSMAYFMPRLNNVKKVAYAPSMGYGEFKNTDYENDVKNALKNFDHISVREDDGADKIKNLIGNESKVDVVLDPTLLLPTTEYDKICANNKIKGDYIFFYSVGFRPQNAQIMKYVSEKTGLPVYTLSTSSSSLKYKSYGINISEYSSPEDFLALVKNAKLVFSSSFHGNVFAVIFRKDFYSLYTFENGKRTDDPRLNTLYKSLGLKDRGIDIENYKNLDYFKPIEYNEEKIKSEIERSKNYLINAVLE